MVRKRKNERKLWKEKEIEYLLDTYGEVPLSKMANQLGRSEQAIVSKHYKLTGIESECETACRLTSAIIMETFNVVQSTINKWAIVKGLPFTNITNSLRSKRVYEIKTFWKWVEENKETIDFHKCQTGIILPEPAWYVEEVRLAKVQGKPKQRRWSKSESDVLLFMIASGHSHLEVAERLNRTKDSIEKKAKRIRNS